MNLAVLKHLIDNAPEKMEDAARKANQDPGATLGVAQFILGNGGDLKRLSDKQRFHWDKFIGPLLENVPCEGVVGDDTCTGNGFVDDESLLLSYQEDEFLCQHCRYDRDRMRDG